MSPWRSTLLTLLSVSLPACGGSSGGTATSPGGYAADLPTAATLGEQVVLPSADYLELPRYRDADPDAGRHLTLQCRACHHLDRPESTPLGPSLHGMFGRQAGSLADYRYSPALAEADFVWTPRALDAWLAAPWRFLPGNRMAYAGLPDAAARDALIAALLRMTSPQTEEDDA